MLEILRTWYHRHFTNPEAVILFFLLFVGFAVLITMGKILAPVLAAIVIAFVLDWLVRLLTRLKVPRSMAVYSVFTLFIGLLILIVMGLVPAIWQQTIGLFSDAPRIITSWHDTLMTLPERYPEIFAAEQMNEILNNIRSQSLKSGQYILEISKSSIPAVITMVVYFIIVPLMVFFFLKDQHKIQSWMSKFIPQERGLSVRVWDEVHDQLGNYVLGKIAEVFIVGVVTWIVFALLGLQYTLLLAAMVGLSVLVPYVGAAVITIPVALVALYQFGLGIEFWYVLLAYGVIQAVDGNMLAPLLFSEAVDIHPVAIIIAIVFFGGIWGFWGVFFAIPLAILIRAVINVWP